MNRQDRQYIIDEAERLKLVNDGKLSLYDICCIALDMDRKQLKPIIDVLVRKRILPYGTLERLQDAGTRFSDALAESREERLRRMGAFDESLTGDANVNA